MARTTPGVMIVVAAALAAGCNSEWWQVGCEYGIQNHGGTVTVEVGDRFCVNLGVDSIGAHARHPVSAIEGDAIERVDDYRFGGSTAPYCYPIRLHVQYELFEVVKEGTAVINVTPNPGAFSFTVIGIEEPY